jgi:hypothetical protein
MVIGQLQAALSLTSATFSGAEQGLPQKCRSAEVQSHPCFTAPPNDAGLSAQLAPPAPDLTELPRLGIALRVSCAKAGGWLAVVAAWKCCSRSDSAPGSWWLGPGKAVMPNLALKLF